MGTLVASMPPAALADGTSQSSDESSASSTSSSTDTPSGTSSVADAPSGVRLFVGNLVPAISNDALTALLSKFGAVGAVERNAERRFAHVAFSGDVERCISSIHKTRWLGTELRVEKATEHFMARLRREWAARDLPADVDDAERDVVLPSFSWRGKRTVFRDDAPAPPPAARGADVERVHVPAPRKVEASSRAPRAADVTLELFGLAPAGDDATHAAQGGKDAGASQGDASRPPSKVAAARATLVDNTAEMMAIGDNPSKIDVKSEHARAAAVMDLILGTLASNDVGTASNAAVPKRKALYKQLMKAGDAGGDAPGSAKSLPPASSTASGECVRRKGLYKTLLRGSS